MTTPVRWRPSPNWKDEITEELMGSFRFEGIDSCQRVVFFCVRRLIECKKAAERRGSETVPRSGGLFLSRIAIKAPKSGHSCAMIRFHYFLQARVDRAATAAMCVVRHPGLIS